MNKSTHKNTEELINYRHPRGRKSIEELLSGIDPEEIKELNKKIQDQLYQKPIGKELI